MSEECINGCEFQQFVNGMFTCCLYDTNLHSQKSLELDNPEKIIVFRCNKCVNEGKIGSGDISEACRKIRQRLGWILDSFYSFKDDIEQETNNIMRILTELEEKIESE